MWEKGQEEEERDRPSGSDKFATSQAGESRDILSISLVYRASERGRRRARERTFIRREGEEGVSFSFGSLFLLDRVGADRCSTQQQTGPVERVE